MFGKVTQSDVENEHIENQNITEEKAYEASEDGLKSETLEGPEIELEEDNASFIGPKLPKLMSKAEVEEFQRELFAKLELKFNLKGLLDKRTKENEQLAVNWLPCQNFV